MAIHNTEIAEKFSKLANLLEIEGANPFRVRAYRNAARIIASLGKNAADLIAANEDLTQLPGIGDDLAEKIKTIVQTGELPLLNEIEAKTPPLLNDLMRIEGLGPKRIKIIYKKLRIKNIDDLKTAIKKGHLRKIHGFGPKTEQSILTGIDSLSQVIVRHKLNEVIPIANSLTSYLKKNKNIQLVECAGSFRRRKETIGDLDILVGSENGKDVIEHFIKFEEVAHIYSKGTTRSTVRLHSGLQVDLRVVPMKSYGSALLYFTGSKDHNIALRKIAIRKKLKLNEYGIFKKKKFLAGRSEIDVYHQIGLTYIEPELREDRGEIDAARQKTLPKLIRLNDIRGDLHCFCNQNGASLDEIAKAAESFGYEYIAIGNPTNHSKEFDHKAFFAQIDAIDKLNNRLKNLTLLKSLEVSILEDGSLNISNDILKEVDFTFCAINSQFDLARSTQTERIIRAMDNPYFRILAHPTGRLINQREMYSIDVEKILLAAKERLRFLELNAQPDRLDLNDVYCKMAKDLDVKIAICSNAENISQFSNMQLGIYQARRGWLDKENVLNSRSMKTLLKILK